MSSSISAAYGLASPASISEPQVGYSMVARRSAESTPEEHSYGMVLYIFGVLTLGAMIRRVMKRFPVPYTVMMFLLGTGFGALTTTSVTVQSYATMGNLDGHLILTMFLPALIFESSFDLDLHIFKKSLTQCLTLATVGVAIATVTTAFFAKQVFPYNWSWSEALLYGCIASATDPVAVVSLLAEVGASKKLATVIEGESLLNDGTAIVFFAVLLRTVSATSTVTFESILMSMFKMCVCGPIAGLAFGIIITFWLEHVHNDALVEITITLVGCYAVYWLSEELGLSGVLAVVVFGCYMNGYKMAVSKEVLPNLQKFWHMVAYLANTLIFFTAGLIVSISVIGSNITGTDIGDLFIMYIILTTIRGVTLGILSPFLNRIGYPITWRTGAVITWGGLRGAVGLALALVVNQDPTIRSQVGSKILFQIGGFVMLTLIINAPTVKLLISQLQLDTVTPLDKMVMEKAVHKLSVEQFRTIRGLKANRFLSDSNWAMVEEATTIANPLLKKQKSKFRSAGRVVPGDVEKESMKSPNSSILARTEGIFRDNMEQDLKEATRGRFLNQQKVVFYRLYEEGVLEQESARTLEGLADKAIDSDVGALIEIEDLVTTWRIPVIYSIFKETPGIKHFVTWRIKMQLSSAFDIGMAFIIASEEAISVIMSTMNESARHDVIYRARQTMKYVHRRLDELQIKYLDITHRIKTKHAISHILQGLMRTLDAIKENGIVDKTDIKMIREMIERKELAALRLKEVPPQSAETIMDSFQWIKYMRETECGYEFKNMTCASQTVLVDAGDEPSVMVIIRGMGKLIADNRLDEAVVMPLSAGTLVGLMECACNIKPPYIITSDTEMEVKSITYANLHDAMKNDDELNLMIWQDVGSILAMAVIRDEIAYKHMPEKKVHALVSKGKTSVHKKHTRVNLEMAEMVVLLKGTLSTSITGVIDGPLLLPDEVSQLDIRSHECFLFVISSGDVVENEGHQEDKLKNKKNMKDFISKHAGNLKRTHSRRTSSNANIMGSTSREESNGVDSPSPGQRVRSGLCKELRVDAINHTPQSPAASPRVPRRQNSRHSILTREHDIVDVKLADVPARGHALSERKQMISESRLSDTSTAAAATGIVKKESGGDGKSMSDTADMEVIEAALKEPILEDKDEDAVSLARTASYDAASLMRTRSRHLEMTEVESLMVELHEVGED